MDDSLNKVKVIGHQGPHPKEYHNIIYNRLDAATRQLHPNTKEYKDAVINTLNQVKQEISTPGSKLNKLVTKEN